MPTPNMTTRAGCSLPRPELRALRGRLFLAPQVPPLPPRQRVVTAVLAGRLPAMGLGRSLRSLFYPDDIPAAHVALDRFEGINSAALIWDAIERKLERGSDRG